MNMFPDLITIINVVDKKGIKEYYYHVISGVLFENNSKYITKQYGVDSADSKVCYIPLKSMLEKYVDEITYKNLEDEAKTEYVTLKNGDYIVKGLVSSDIGVNDLRLYFSDVMKISSIDFMLRGNLQHFEVFGA